MIVRLIDRSQDQVQRLIQHYFATIICPLIAMENYVIEFVVYDASIEDNIIVIELNPWAKTTGKH